MVTHAGARRFTQMHVHLLCYLLPEGSRQGFRVHDGKP
jgi:hypothetical protein